MSERPWPPWMIRLRRAFHRVERLQRSIARIEREITHLEEL